MPPQSRHDQHVHRDNYGALREDIDASPGNRVSAHAIGIGSNEEVASTIPVRAVAQNNREILDVRLEEWIGCITTKEAIPRPQVTPEERKRGRRRILMQKYMFQISIITVK
ncbi:hypothetical protein BDV38DRAFT_280011 [Aspergillus pseudotamarii]|uniref:Uncharacterized protein n=1 Tax=Aspergillus pseudotamarii TaxID=132259 RepID=A0A5N6T2I0_ASPPS|nr:uncharacterized protein BDV38DRAFT_280011 [Aspergillus pseudotamarii]KAE8140512.1 hypothetical protein BDV38DRAFT_280011 [Aspergillus pseudotamarii]